MATYIPSETIANLRRARGLAQAGLAARIGVTDKAVSKWETGRGLSDITLIEPLAAELGISVAELLTGDVRQNANRAGNMARCIFHACPICGNVVVATGEGVFSCCGSTMLPQETEEPGDNDAHAFSIERIENDWLVALDHPMTKSLHVSFVAYVTTDSVCLKIVSRATRAAALPYLGKRLDVFVLQSAWPLSDAYAKIGLEKARQHRAATNTTLAFAP